MFGELLYKWNRKLCIFHSFPEVNSPSFVRVERKTKQTKTGLILFMNFYGTPERLMTLLFYPAFYTGSFSLKNALGLHLSLPVHHWSQFIAAPYSSLTTITGPFSPGIILQCVIFITFWYCGKQWTLSSLPLTKM